MVDTCSSIGRKYADEGWGIVGEGGLCASVCVCVCVCVDVRLSVCGCMCGRSGYVDRVVSLSVVV